MNNNPIKFNDPTGHDGECENDPVCSEMLDTFVAAAIQTESPVGSVLGIPERPRWVFGWNKYTGLGPAKVSDAEMEGEYGKVVDQKHEKVGLGLRTETCNSGLGGCEMDQIKPEVASLAMKTRLTLRLDICVQHGCNSTDMVMVALLAADERVTPTQLDQAFKNKDYKIKNGPSTLDWHSYLSNNWKKPDDINKNKQLINRFSTNVQNLRDFHETKWDYIEGLGK